MPNNAPDLESVLDARPELLAKYKAFYTNLCTDENVPHRVRELCRLRVAAVHGCDAEWQLRSANVTIDEEELTALRAGKLQSFAPSEQAALSIAQTLPFGQHELSDDQVTAARSHLGEFCAALNVPEARQHLIFGRPESEIQRISEAEGADLIVVGSHGRHGLALLLGSTANGVLHGATCDVLAVRVGK